MAFEPKTSIAQVVNAGAAKYQYANPLGALATGYEGGLRKASLNMQRRRMDEQSKALAMEKAGGMATSIAMLPESQRVPAWNQFRVSMVSGFGMPDPGPYSIDSLRQVMASTKTGQQYMLGEHQQQIANQQYGSLQEGVDAQGNPKFFRINQLGNQQTLPNMSPMPDKPLVDMSNTTIHNPNSPEFKNIYQEESEKGQAKSDIAYVDNLFAAEVASVEADYMNARAEANIANGVKTGAAQPLIFAFKSWAKDLGLEMEGVTGATEIDMLAKDAALKELAAFKGPTTDFEFTVALSKVGNLGTDPEAFRRYLQLRRRVAQRARESAQVARDYIKANNGSRRGIQGHISKWSAENPLVSTMPSGVDPYKWIETVPTGALFVNPADGKFLIKRQ